MNGLLTRPFVRQASSIYAMQAIGMAAAMLTSVLIARTLGPTGKGAVDLFVLLTSLIAEFGLTRITSRFTYPLANRGRPLAQVHGNAVVAATLLGTLGLSAAAVLSALREAFGDTIDVPQLVLVLGIRGLPCLFGRVDRADARRGPSAVDFPGAGCCVRRLACCGGTSRSRWCLQSRSRHRDHRCRRCGRRRVALQSRQAAALPRQARRRLGELRRKPPVRPRAAPRQVDANWLHFRIRPYWLSVRWSAWPAWASMR